MPTYRFRTYTKKSKRLSRKYMDIEASSTYHACNTFLKQAFKINMNIIHLSPHTINLEENLGGRDALVCDEIIKCKFMSRPIMFHIQEVKI